MQSHIPKPLSVYNVEHCKMGSDIKNLKWPRDEAICIAALCMCMTYSFSILYVVY